MSSKLRRQCGSCHGIGRVADPDHGRGQPCEYCEGTGIQLVVVDETTGKYYLKPGELPPGEMHGECPSCEGKGIFEDPQHGHSMKCGQCHGTGLIPHAVCEVPQCQRRVHPGRKICESHAFPAARPKGTTGRKAAIAHTHKKIAEEAKVSEDSTDGVDEEMKSNE